MLYHVFPNVSPYAGYFRYQAKKKNHTHKQKKKQQKTIKESVFVNVSAFTACQITAIKRNREMKRKEIVQKYTVCLLAGTVTPAGVSAYFPCPFSPAAVAESFTVTHTS